MDHLHQKNHRWYALLLVLAWFASMQVFCAGIVLADTVKSIPPLSKQPIEADKKITLEELKKKTEVLLRRQDVEETLQKRVLNNYYAIQKNLSDWTWYQSQRNLFKERVQKFPEESKLVRQKIEQSASLSPSLNQEKLVKSTSQTLEQLLFKEKNTLGDLDSQLATKENELSEQSGRPEKIRQEIVAAKLQIEAALVKQKGLKKESRSKLEFEAQQWLVRSSIEARQIEITMLEAEVISNPYQVQLLKDEVQWLELQRKYSASRVDGINAELVSRRQLEAKQEQQDLAQIEKSATEKHPAIKTVTLENIQYSKKFFQVNGKINDYLNEKRLTEQYAREIEKEYKSAEKKIDLARLSPKLGKVLRKQRRDLDSKRQQYFQQALESERAAISLEQYNLEQEQKRFEDTKNVLKTLMIEQVGDQLPRQQKQQVRTELSSLLNSQQELLNKLTGSYATFLSTIGDFDFEKQKVLDLMGQYADFLDERLLWVPSSGPISKFYPFELYQTLEWLFSPTNWQQVILDVYRIVRENPLVMLFGILSLLILVSMRSQLVERLRIINAKVTKLYTDKFEFTPQALLYTVILEIPNALALYFIGWLLVHDLQGSDYSRAIGNGLSSSAIPLFFMQLFYRLFSINGIARNHFAWQESSVEILHSLLKWARFLIIPAIFLTAMTGVAENTAHSDSLGRFALITVMLVMSYILMRLLRFQDGLIHPFIKNNPDNWLVKLRWIWYPAIVSLPLIVIGFAVAGYYLSALELHQKLIFTLRLVFISIVIHELVIRWLTLVNRQLALNNARQKRKAAEETAKKLSASSEEPVINVEEQLLDIPKINAQTIKLLHMLIGICLIFGDWLIWKDILPAFSFFDNVVLWQHMTVVDSQEVYQPITLSNLILAVIAIFISVVAVRNLPGLMEVLVFRRLSVASGSRYAINQLVQYALVAIGFIAVASELGGRWSQVQWLVAALGVGLGFGLQEIFANLVSGIILLFERPIRIGDTVTVGDTTGRVSKIHMRATRIIDWDQKELIVPNKTFITNQLVNWTLTDQITRITVPIGVGYGSNVEYSHAVMSKVVKTTPLVLADPEPTVYFVGFGDSSLDFSIRVFVAEFAQRLIVKHDLLLRLERALRDNNIEIPFPQRDVHIRTSPQYNPEPSHFDGLQNDQK
ncbi:MAG: mechanosensitive ion channel domain-containing protein [Methylococcaceae bacterium]